MVAILQIVCFSDLAFAYFLQAMAFCRSVVLLPQMAVQGLGFFIRLIAVVANIVEIDAFEVRIFHIEQRIVVCTLLFFCDFYRFVS